MNDLQSLLNLPLGTLALLASGYLGYRTAYVGKDQAHQTVDVLFISSVFALLARMVSDATAPWGVNASLILGMFAAALGAAIWRKWVSGWLYRALRFAGVSQSDRHASVIHSLIAREQHRPSQLILRKKDGAAIMCERLSDFQDAPFGPYMLGPDGSVGIYVTDYRAAGSTGWVSAKNDASAWGRAFTVIAADQIGEIEIRFAS